MSARCPLRATAAVDDGAFQAIRRELVLDACKWDPQVGDVDALARFALVLDRGAWAALAAAAEALARELDAIEEEIVRRPAWHGELGVPRALRRLFRAGRPATPAAVRSLRFDFHWTGDRFVLSEVNSDVPGGFAESSALSSAMRARFPELRPAGDPGARWADALAARIDARWPVALVVAPGFLEDLQVVAYLRRALAERGVRAVVGHARHLRADAARVALRGDGHDGRVAAVVRFYQAEWLATLPALASLAPLFVGGATPVTNPAAAAITESKRLPLVWDRLRASTAAFRAAMPETRDPRDAPWLRDGDGWVLKGTYSNTGDAVVFPDRLSRRARAALALHVAARPAAWVAQRRFHVAPIATPLGPARPCIGVYTIDARAAGVYARIATREIIDGAAVDAACLIEAA